MQFSLEVQKKIHIRGERKQRILAGIFVKKGTQNQEKVYGNPNASLKVV